MKKIDWKLFFKSLNILDWIELLIVIMATIICLVALFKFLFLGSNKTMSTPVGEYKCSGGFIKVCSGDSKVAEYLGV